MYDINQKTKYNELLEDIYKKIRSFPKYDSLVFKGGFALLKLLNSEGRMTKDIDISVINSNMVLELIDFLENTLTGGDNNGISYDIVKMRKDINSGTIKLSYYDSITGIDYRPGIDIRYEDGSVTVIAKDDMILYHPITMLVDKLVAISDYDMIRRRLKDIVDIFLIYDYLDGVDANEVVKELSKKRPKDEIKNSIDSEDKYREIEKVLLKFTIKNNIDIDVNLAIQRYIKLAEEVSFLKKSSIDWMWGYEFYKRLYIY